MLPTSSQRDAALSPDGVLELVLADRTRVPLLHDLTIGRAPGNTVRLDDPAVSRQQARISAPSGADGRILLEDAGSRSGTWLDGRLLHGPAPLRDGARIRMGDQELLVERRRGDDEAGRTIVVPATSTTAADGAPASADAGRAPRLRPGYALKRLDASEGERRWVMQDLASNRFLRLADADAELLQELDGRHEVAELVQLAERRDGEAGAARLARLLSELAERGLLDGVAAATPAPRGPRAASRLVGPHVKVLPGAGAWFTWLHRHGGRWLLTRPALAAIGTLVMVGVLVFAWLVVARYGTPFVVARKVGIGAAIFIAGRLAVVAVHESAHGLVMASVGRRVRRAGIKVIVVFPYAFVDTSEAWFEPRRRRLAISAAGPVSDLSLGALFALGCLALPAGALRDIAFQLSFAAYVGACFNLNPFVERDGYQILADALGEPGLRRRARDQLRRRLAGERGAGDSRLLSRYAVAGLAWSVVTACIAVGMSLRYAPRLEHVASAPAVWATLAVVWIGCFLPVVAVLGGPLRERLRRGRP